MDAPPRGFDELRVFTDAPALARAAAADFLDRAAAAIAARGRFSAALAGGSTPLALFRELATQAPARGFDWRPVHLFWSDERMVPPDDPASNWGAARRELLARIGLPDANVHRIRGEAADPQREAERYADELRRLLAVNEPVPRLDLIDLGLGPDGHTASLFPATDALAATALVAVGEAPSPPRRRLTFTYPLISAARGVRFLVAGAAKAAIVADVLEGEWRPTELPAQRVRPEPGALAWWVDEAAAARLTRR